MNRTFVIVAIVAMALAASTGCHRWTGDDSLVVGVWTYEGVDAARHTSFMADHTLVGYDRSGFGRMAIVMTGRWRLEEGDLITETKPTNMGEGDPKVVKTSRIAIIEFTKDRLRVKDGPDFIRMKN